MSSPHVRQLAQSCEQGELAVFTGAGISRDKPSNLPLWPDLVNSLLRDLARTDSKRRYNQMIESLIDRNLPSEVVVQFIAGYDEPTCKQAVADVFAGAVPNRHHHRLAGLAHKISVFVTTNYDNCLEQALTARGVEFKLLINDSDFLWACEALANKTLRGPVVAKIHGDLEESHGMVMMLSESRRGLSGAKKRFMNYLHQNRHVLFLGYSGGDLYLDDNRLLMRNAAASARGFTWVFRPGAIQSGAVDNLIDLYNRAGQNKAAKLETDLDDLLPSLSPNRNGVDTMAAEGLAASPAKEARWPQNVVKRPVGLLIAEMLMHAGDLSAAEEVLGELVRSGDNSNDSMTRLTAAGSLARLAQRRGDHHRALTVLAQSNLESIGFQEADLKHAQASLQVISAESLSVVGRIDDAIKATREACDTFSNLGDYKILLIALGNHSNYLREKGRITEAKETLESSLRLATQFGDVDSEAAAYNNLSLIYSQLGDQLQAIEKIDKAISLATSIGDSRGVCRGYTNRGQALNYAGRLDEAYGSFHKASELAQKIGMQADLGRAETGMGVVEFNRGSYGKAVEHWTKALEIATQLGDFLGQTELLNNVAEVMRRSGELQQALKYINRAIRQMNEKGFSLRTSPYLHTRGMIHLDLQQYAEAEQDFTTAVEQYSQLGNLRAQASETYHAGIAIALQHRPAEAEARFTRAEKIQREINDRRALANTLLFKGKICLPLQKRDNMIAYFQEAIGILKELGMFERAQESIDELNYYLEP